MEPNPQPPRCGHIGALSFTHLTAAGEVAATRPIPCRADATHLVDCQHYRCSDHLGAVLVEAGRSWEVVRLDAPLGRDLDEALTAAGAPCTLDRLQEHHATTAARIDLIASQRDQLKAALAWLDDDHQRLAQVDAYIKSQHEAILADAKRPSWRVIHNPEAYAEMHTPTVGRAICDLAGATFGRPSA